MRALTFSRFGGPEVLEYRELFAWLRDGALAPSPPTPFRLADGAAAHRLLERRAATGPIVLIP